MTRLRFACLAVLIVAPAPRSLTAQVPTPESVLGFVPGVALTSTGVVIRFLHP